MGVDPHARRETDMNDLAQLSSVGQSRIGEVGQLQAETNQRIEGRVSCLWGVKWALVFRVHPSSLGI